MNFNVSIHHLEEFATDFWQLVKTEKIFAFHGEMGAGKTTIITALCKEKGVSDIISSPTFSIINEYSFNESHNERIIYHLDLYRLNSMEEIIQAGVEDCIYSGEICFIEWPEKAPGLLDEKTVHVFIEMVDDTTRLLKIELPAAS
ncbi:MAG TPA: tRNA (adenosine(37)-N6)-threonylcarbamoyltransferase complex ATPase subunit type 1 TsaE [Chitinophagaceae bacterium]|nr:tRNA (adenosine(37)-N6)-threonylcarbamoyltransferase complex ATPase subunit type 1 TsaE [Chitinophagaceae bacterium]